jgi:hypothetical protein
MQAELARSSSWLEDTTGRFQHLKNLAKDRRIVAITQDFCRASVFRQLTQTLHRLDCCIDTFYLSNLYALPLDSFYCTLNVLMLSNPIVIHCTTPIDCQCAHGCQCPKEQHLGRNWKK